MSPAPAGRRPACSVQLISGKEPGKSNVIHFLFYRFRYMQDILKMYEEWSINKKTEALLGMRDLTDNGVFFRC